MRGRKRNEPSLEHELKRFVSEKIKKDPRGRTRAELLASTLWNRSLAGDRDSLRMLLDRLPVVEPQPDAEPSTAPAANPASSVPTSYEAVTNAFKALCEAGIIPVEAFAWFAFKDFAKDNPDWEDPDKMQ